MKNIQKYNVHELSKKESEDINGGGLLAFLAGAALALIVIGWIRGSKKNN